MRTSAPRLRRRRSRRGLGLVELLIALSISAAMLTAVAVATDTSFKAYAINEEQSSLLQRGRLTMNRMLTYIRTCKEHQPLNTGPISQFTLGFTATDSGISMLTDSGVQLDFTYDPINQRLSVVEDGTSRVLLSGVTAFQVKMEPMQSVNAIKTGGGFDLLRRATVLITLQTHGAMSDIDESAHSQTITLSSSVMPRRNAW